MLLTIARESRSGAVQPSLEVLYPTATAAREALPSLPLVFSFIPPNVRNVQRFH